ncbi:MAG: hypothetical protein IT185_05800 [Acidobacteria bacterium]|nr:hypothetical protein [Acidobacteriota bacterium]
MALAVAVPLPAAQVPAPQPRPKVERLGPTLVGVGTIRVDTAAKELRIPGRMNRVITLEFIANTPQGLKEYESAITLETDAVTLNTALLLLGLDPSRARVPTQHLDPVPAAGDPVSITVEWKGLQGLRRIPAEELLWNVVTKSTVPGGPFVYTGSTLTGGRLLADADGVLIGFIHSPAPLIDSPRPIPARNYGDIILNPNLDLPSGTAVTLVVRALDRSGK